MDDRQERMVRVPVSQMVGSRSVGRRGFGVNLGTEPRPEMIMSTTRLSLT